MIIMISLEKDGMIYQDLLRYMAVSHDFNIFQHDLALDGGRCQAKKHPDLGCSLLCGQAGFLLTAAQLARARNATPKRHDTTWPAGNQPWNFTR